MCRSSLAKEINSYHPALFANLEVFPYALGNFAGQAEFVVARDALGYSGLKQRRYDWPTRLERIPVEVRRLDDLVLDLPSLRYIKVDAEGGEYDILQGALKCLCKFRPLVSFEFGAGSLEEYSKTPADMAIFWAEHKYVVYDILGNHLPHEQFVDSATRQHLWDYVAVPLENTALNDSIRTILTKPPPWQRVTNQLDVADHCADVGAAVPRLSGFKGVKGWLARRAAHIIILASQVVSVPQRNYNRALWRSLRALVRILREAESRNAEQAGRIAGLEESVAALQARLECLKDSPGPQSQADRAA
jgi:FkbM family methyltransferase